MLEFLQEPTIRAMARHLEPAADHRWGAGPAAGHDRPGNGSAAGDGAGAGQAQRVRGTL
ncbi:hypothetical protein ABGB16_11785 [Micromonospora sp. B11E3]|uniref:hypothetical protein n=1 Tax=Micromonospora sp. B11E3 TaxID=3153562 RepID=UPI00325D5EE5